MVQKSGEKTYLGCKTKIRTVNKGMANYQPHLVFSAAGFLVAINSKQQKPTATWGQPTNRGGGELCWAVDFWMFSRYKKA